MVVCHVCVNIPPPFRLSRVISVPSCSTIFAASSSAMKDRCRPLCCIQPNGGDVLCSVSRFFDNLNRGFRHFTPFLAGQRSCLHISTPLLDCGFIYSTRTRSWLQSHSIKCVVPHLQLARFRLVVVAVAYVRVMQAGRRLLSLISAQQVQPPSLRE